ncbi:MAG: hydroxyacylglutathione hydrolase [Alphaproteobacteria bacterium]
MTLTIEQFSARDDNFAVLIHDSETGATASIDAPEVEPIRVQLAARGWRLDHILTTHHHDDHTKGNLPLKEEYGCTIIGPAGGGSSIPGIDRKVGQGETFEFGGFDVSVLETPGHTLDHISYYIPAAAVVFAADTLFAVGCGRIFEGTPAMMWDSLQKLAALPDDTTVYCGHEYTAANIRFALSVEPGNAALVARAAEVTALREAGRATLPTTIALEKQTNPFLRPDSPEIRRRLDMADAADVEVFAETRRRKDNF